ncbi:uncharacterized protein A4U43_C08F24550 [Asparagus officinalis]|nr:uncharacterized protein A4U43_C08F24550 [Asparagus officinalis]
MKRRLLKTNINNRQKGFRKRSGCQIPMRWSPRELKPRAKVLLERGHLTQLRKPKEEEQESTAMGLSPQPGLPTVVPTLGGTVSSARSLNEEERGDELFVGGTEFVHEDTFHDITSIAPHVEEDRPPVQNLS